MIAPLVADIEDTPLVANIEDLTRVLPLLQI